MRVPAKDIALINHHRRDLGLRPIDLDAGWTHEELQNMAATLHARGRLPNPRFSKEELKEAKDRETDRALDNRGGALGRAFLGSWVGGAVGSLAGPV
ncbi:MAG: hypothetical protein KAJ42_17295, partial [Gemmatimonadetes bacterium]|nr:hypothetical protein [Gemmatimonadota bacterium]